jgi:quercetin dioxygenase-like cupin family protein
MNPRNSSHDPQPDAETERDESSALWALGALSSDEVAELAPRLESDRALAFRAAEYSEIVAELELAAGTPRAPRPELKARLFDRIRSDPGASVGPTPSMEQSLPAPSPEVVESGGVEPSAPTSHTAGVQVWKTWGTKTRPNSSDSPGLTVVRSSEGDWQATGVEGVRVKHLFSDAARRYVTMLVRMDPGAAYPSHVHGGAEECFVLEGELEVAGTQLREGDYQRAEHGSLHGVQATRDGCLLLIVSSQDDELID